MPDPVTFASAAPRFALPFLFAGQAQKEITVNTVTARLDVLLHCAVESQQPNPPVAPAEGQVWLIAGNPGGAWSGLAEYLAAYIGGGWTLIAPQEGMVLFDRALGAFRHYQGGWTVPAAQIAPTGGSVIDVEARTAIEALVTALQNAGVIPAA